MLKMWKKGIGILISWLLLFPALVLANENTGSITITNSKNSALLQIQTTLRPNYNIIKLSNPDRLVIDLKNITIKTPPSFSKNENLINSFRVGNIDKNLQRAVFEINKNFMIASDRVLKLANNGYLIEINLTKTGIDDIRKKTAPATVNIPKFEPIAKEKLEYKNSVFSNSSNSGPLALVNSNLEAKPKPNSKVNQTQNKVDKKIATKPQEIIAKKGKRKIRVILDPGHGGEDPGAISRKGTREKDVVLKYALTLKQKLEDTGRYVVFMTRSKDVFLTLEERVKKAKIANGDLFISLHADAHPNIETRGLSVYTISEGRAQWELDNLTKKAKRQEVISGLDLRKEKEDVQHLLIDLVQTRTQNTSKSFAEFLVGELGEEAKLLFNPHREAGFVVLTGVNVPAVLMELGYMTNRFEEQLLRTTSYRNKLTNAIATAIEKYFEENPI
jgi:N-acetylmuramoyl-L-alanine amidase